MGWELTPPASYGQHGEDVLREEVKGPSTCPLGDLATVFPGPSKCLLRADRCVRRQLIEEPSVATA